MVSNSGAIRYSRQREKILELLKDDRDHPSADEIYVRMRDYFPSISLGTVYRNLGLLCDRHMVNRIILSDGPDRFDADISAHTHFFCDICNSIYDIKADAPDCGRDSLIEGHMPRKHVSTYFGTCRECLGKGSS